MTVERIAKKAVDFHEKLIVSPMGRCHINKTFSIFQEQYPNIEIESFLKLYSEFNPNKIKYTIKNQLKIQDIIIARSKNDYIHGLYAYTAIPKKKFEIKYLVIPGPLGRQTIVKQFIEHMVGLGLDLQCSRIQINHLVENDWRSLFLQEAGAKRINPNCLQINLST